MKTFANVFFSMVTFLVLGSSSASFAVADCSIYDALNSSQGPANSSLIKTAGSLVCERSATNCHCSLVPGNDEIAFNSLNISEKDVPPEGVLGGRILEKRIADLKCTKKVAVVPNAIPEVSCGFDYGPQNTVVPPAPSGVR